MKWIDCAERLPDVNQTVLIYTPEDYTSPICAAKRIDTENPKDNYDNYFECTCYFPVKHGNIKFWMKLPVLPDKNWSELMKCLDKE